MNVILTNLGQTTNRGHQSRAHRRRRAQGLAGLERALWRCRNLPVEISTKRGTQIEIGNDKVITFQDISKAFNSALNKSSAGVTITSLSYENGRVSLYLKPDTQLTNVKIAEDIARELKIKPDKSNIGEPVDIGKIAFHQHAKHLSHLR